MNNTSSHFKAMKWSLASCSTQQPQHVSSKGAQAFSRHMLQTPSHLLPAKPSTPLGTTILPWAPQSQRLSLVAWSILECFYSIWSLSHWVSPYKHIHLALSQRLVSWGSTGTISPPHLNSTPLIFVKHLNTLLQTTHRSREMKGTRVTSWICPVTLMRRPDQSLVRRVGQRTPTHLVNTSGSSWLQGRCS